MNPQINQSQPPAWNPNNFGGGAVPVDNNMTNSMYAGATAPQSSPVFAAQGPLPSNMLPTPVSNMPSGQPTFPTAPTSVPATGLASSAPQGQGNGAALQPSPQQQTPIQSIDVVAQAAMSPSVQDEAADSVLDEEWVEKAKEVILRTKSDPYAQGQELAKIKAQYIKSRYNKDIKVGDV